MSIQVIESLQSAIDEYYQAYKPMMNHECEHPIKATQVVTINNLLMLAG
jgi:hypothetical protein